MGQSTLSLSVNETQLYECYYEDAGGLGDGAFEIHSTGLGTGPGSTGQYISHGRESCQDASTLASYVRPTKTPRNTTETPDNEPCTYWGHRHTLRPKFRFFSLAQCTTRDPNSAFGPLPKIMYFLLARVVQTNRVTTCVRQGAWVPPPGAPCQKKPDFPISELPFR